MIAEQNVPSCLLNKSLSRLLNSKFNELQKVLIHEEIMRINEKVDNELHNARLLLNCYSSEELNILALIIHELLQFRYFALRENDKRLKEFKHTTYLSTYNVIQVKSELLDNYCNIIGQSIICLIKRRKVYR